MAVAIGGSGGHGGGVIVNDLTTGGTTAGLSAEMGKTLQTTKAPLDSPPFTGTPLVPTAAQGTNTTQVASTAFVIAELAASGRLRVGSGVPSSGLGADGDGYVRNDAPFVGVLYLKAGGAWALAQSTYTWAGRPNASTCSGAVITISDWNQDFYSDGTNWIAVGKQLLMEEATLDANDTGNAAVYVAGTGSLQNLATSSTPAGLIIPGCRVVFEAVVGFVGGTAGKTIYLDDSSGVPLYQFGLTATSTLTHAFKQSLYINDTGLTTNSKAMSLPNSVSVGDTVQNTNSAPTTWTTDYSAAKTWRWRTNTNAADKSCLARRSITVLYK
jgi:hypothetical protein